MPENDGEARKFVREAVQAFPEIYFSRLVVLGEGTVKKLYCHDCFRLKAFLLMNLLFQ